jgi:exodeoxyribonuclease-3
VATLTRREPDAVMYGFREGPDSEDVRVLQVVVDGVAVLNTYVPQGYKVGTDKYVFKLEWFQRLRRYFKERFDPRQAVVWTGDMNVAPEPIDVYHPERRVNDVDFHIDARNAYAETTAWGFVDVFRKLYPDKVQYTYWDYFRNALENNWGWRIDHIMATQPLADVCRAVEVDMGPRRAPGASDHTILWADFDWQ